MEGAVSIKEYQPISLVSCIYKPVAKVFARKMAKVLNKDIGENQHVFMEGRQIMDMVLRANGRTIIQKERWGVMQTEYGEGV